MQFLPTQGKSEILDPDIDPVDIGPDGKDKMSGYWVFRGKSILVKDASATSYSEVILRIKHTVLKEEKALDRIEKQVKSFERMDEIFEAQRERISESVRMFVWQRDEGKCVECGSQKNLEFDHIIPVSKGGSNTERNVQLLCERCNREKGAHL